MSNKVAIIIAVIAVILIGGWLLMRDGSTPDTNTGEDAVIAEQIEQLRATDRSGVVTRATAAQEGATTLKVDAVNFLSPGFIVIRANESGTPGDVLGSSSLIAGFRESVTVELDRALLKDETVYVVLYTDTNADGSFDATGDEVITDAATGAIITLKVVADPTPDATNTQPRTYTVS